MKLTKTKRDIAEHVALTHGIDIIKALGYTDSMFEAMRTFMEDGHNISVRRFANFTRKERKAKVAQNISARTPIHLPAKVVVKVILCKEIKAKIK